MPAGRPKGSKTAKSNSKFVSNAGYRKVSIDFGAVNPKQAQFVESRTLYTCYGGARGGGKTHIVRIQAVGGATRWPGIKILIMRRTYPELQSNHIEPIVKFVPQELGRYNGSLRQINFYNGSIIRFGHWSGAMSELEYQGQEYDWIFMDEATQFTEEVFRMLGACLRGVNKIPKRFYLTCNPGGIGHFWVKRLFVDRDFKRDSEDERENENPDDYTFIFASVYDNEALLKDSPQYLKQLSAMPERLRAAHRDGDWDAMSGQYFEELSERHIIEPFKIPETWTRYRAFDYGLDMLACVWAAVDPGGRMYIYREFGQSNLIVQDAAEAMLENTLPGERIEITFAPPDMWTRTKDSGKTMAETFMLNDLAIVQASNNRVQGHMMIKDMLANLSDGKPGLVIFRTCATLIKNLKAIQVDEKNPSDCAKDPHDVTHFPDALRYLCISRVMPGSDGKAQAQDDDEDDETEDYETFMTGGEPSMSYIA